MKKTGFVWVVAALFAAGMLLSGCPKNPPPSEPVADEPQQQEAAAVPEPTAPAPLQEEPVDDTAGLKPVGDVFFDYNSYVLREDAKATLRDNAATLKAKGQSVLVEGHCDERGTSEYNIAVGQKRAEAVKRYLVMLGVKESSIQVKSYGEEKPFCTASTESCWQQNRRGHFVVR
ncbi:MAG: peptidoglycan-associated lipoprotein Pal [Deltaproteobacteria bacterium]|nr:peptidoglycan-associated lipoprotein Pal [Deltaproteobacteria bacterium]